MNKSKSKNLFILLTAFVVALILTFIISYAMYISQTPKSNNNVNIEDFKPNDAVLTNNNCAVNNTNYDVYVRAYIYTYWTLTPNNQENELVAKDAWTISDNYINSSNWTKIGNFYYYNSELEKGETAEYLVDNSIQSNLLTNYDDTGAISSVQSYRIVYEYVYAYKNETSNSSAEVWNVIIDNNTVTTSQ